MAHILHYTPTCLARTFIAHRLRQSSIVALGAVHVIPCLQIFGGGSSFLTLGLRGTTLRG